MLSIDGLLGCAVVDGTTGLVLARESREDQPADIDLSAAASAQVLRCTQHGGAQHGPVGADRRVHGQRRPRQQVLRTVTRHPDLFLMALLDKHRANLALARYKLMEVEKSSLAAHRSPEIEGRPTPFAELVEAATIPHAGTLPCSSIPHEPGAVRLHQAGRQRRQLHAHAWAKVPEPLTPQQRVD
jgi:hypothetical protein